MPKAAFGALDHAETVLARPDEARNVVRVDGQRRHDVAGRSGRCPSCLRWPATRAARRQRPSGCWSRPGRTDHALAHHVAVGLVVVGGDAGAQEVSLVVAAQGAPAGFAFGHQGDARLAGAAEELAERIGVGVLVGKCAESGGNVAAGGLGAVNSFSRQRSRPA